MPGRAARPLVDESLPTYQEYIVYGAPESSYTQSRLKGPTSSAQTEKQMRRVVVEGSVAVAAHDDKELVLKTVKIS